MEGRVPYLRTIATRALKRRTQRSCSSCHRFVCQFERYCPYCATLNQSFDAIVFEQIALSTFSDVLQWHDRDPDGEHDLLRFALHDLRDGRRGLLRYCTLCGSLLSLPWSPDEPPPELP